MPITRGVQATGESAMSSYPPLDSALRGLARGGRVAIVCLGCAIGAGASTAQPVPPQSFVLEETTIAAVHAALAAKRLTCVQLVRAYLDRIEAYDDKGPSLTAIITVSPRAVQAAEELDRQYAANRSMRSLHCVPVILKDNYDTFDMATSGGAKTLANSIPPDDAFVVARLREAGAVILAKANLTELARHGTTVSSLGGQTKNPYDLTRTAGGSSGGTGAAIAANFGLVGTGSDTGQSIRSPASANNLVGVRPTRGLVSRDGIIPFSTTQDEIGPITRTVEDAARMLDVMAGYDPADPITAFGSRRKPRSYTDALTKDGLRAARIGVLTDFFGRDPVHLEVNTIVEGAVARMSALGATTVQVRIPNLDVLTRDLSLMSFEFGSAFNRYLASLGPAAPVRTLDEFIARGEFHSSIKTDLETDRRMVESVNSAEYNARVLRREAFRQAVMSVMATHQLDALLYPHQRRLVALIGDEQLERNGVLSNGTGFPAITIPAGFSTPTASAPKGIPVGVEFLAQEWGEPTLFKLAYAFQEGARVRQPPSSTPPLR